MTPASGPRLAVRAVVLDAGRLLLVNAYPGEESDLWCVPGGGAERGLSLEENLRREVREETGLVVTPRRLVGIYSDPSLQVVRYPDGNVWHYISICFECTVRGGELTLCDETLALDWFSPRRLPRPLLPHHRIRIRDARARRPGAFVR